LKKTILDVIHENGYVKIKYGYKKVTEKTTHWITVFEEDKIQMYGYETDDLELVSIYNTGIIFISPVNLQSFIDVFNSNYKYD